MTKNKLRKGKVPVISKDLEGSTIAEANNDGTIFLDKDVKPDSPLGKEAIAHEKVHMDQMKRGDLNYDDNYVYWKGKKYSRESMAEGAPNLPWEKEAYDKTGDPENTEAKIEFANENKENKQEIDAAFDHNIYDRISKLNIPKNTKTTNNMAKKKKTPAKLSFGLSKNAVAGNMQTLNSFEDSAAGKVAMAGKAVAGGLEHADKKAKAEQGPPMKATPITKKAKWWETGAENIKKKAEEKKKEEKKAEPKKEEKKTDNKKLPPEDLGIKRMAKLKEEKKKRDDAKTWKDKLYEHTAGRIDTQEERDVLKDKASSIWNKFKKGAKKASKYAIAGGLGGPAGLAAVSAFKMKGSPLSEDSTAVREFKAESGGKVGTAKETTKKSGTPGETKVRKTWKQAWADNDEGINEMYDSYEDYVKDRRAQQEADPEGYEKDLFDKTGVAGGPGTVTTEGDEVTEVETEFDPDEETKRGNYNMGYREAMDAKWGEGVMHRDRKQNMRKYNRYHRKFKEGTINPETGEPFANAHEFASYKLGGKDWDTKYNTQVGKRGPDSTSDVDYDPTKHGDLESVTVGKTTTENQVDAENDANNAATDTSNNTNNNKDKDNSPNKIKGGSFKMKGWSGYNK